MINKLAIIDNIIIGNDIQTRGGAVVTKILQKLDSMLKFQQIKLH